MAYISQLKYEDASGETKRVIDEWVNEHGPLTNMKETLIHSIPAFHALMEWFPLEAEIESFLGERAVNFFCYAISTTNDCLLCSVFFKKILDDEGILERRTDRCDHGFCDHHDRDEYNKQSAQDRT